MKSRTTMLIGVLGLAAGSLHHSVPGSHAEGKPAATGDAVAYAERSQAARASYAAADFAKAAVAYQTLAESNPEDGENWLRLGRSRFQLKEYRPAIEALRRASDLGFGRLQQNQLDIARAYAQLGDKDSALDWLSKALHEQRYEFRPNLEGDKAFEGLRADPRFRQLAGLLPAREFTRDDGWRYDLDYLLVEIQRLNATYSRQPLPAPVREAADRLRSQIPALSDAQIAVGMQRLLALLGCSHNSLFPADGGRVKFTRLPLACYIFPDGLYVIDGEGELKNLVGTRVVRFDDTDAAMVVRSVSALVRRENDMEARWLAPSSLMSPQALHALGLTTSPEQVRLTVSRDGRETAVMVKPGKPPAGRKLFASKVPGAPVAPMYLENVAVAYWFNELPEDRTVYFQFNQVMDKPDETLPAFAKRLSRFLDEHHIQNLVVDLRHNNGGNTYLYPELVRTIVHFDAGSDDRKLFVLIGRNTYSAATNFVVDVERFTRAVFVGEPTGGKPNTHGDESPTVLPYSGLRFLLSCVYWQLSSPRDTRVWIAPSFPVSLSAADYFANRDPAMEAVLELIRKARRP
ncbi:MAG: TPR end-of-group domain-containing protein [Gemmataceae bacterium]